jgi:uncharacterized protein (DUF433 family)
MSTVSYPHIEQRPDGKLFISGTPFKVRQIVLDHVAYGWAAEEIQRQHPQLSMGQVHAALTYYYDHKEELDREIEQGQELADGLRDQQGRPLLAEKLRAAGKELP